MKTLVKNEMKLRTLSLALASVFAGLVAMPAQADLTGNIGVVSKYVLRGITNSNSLGTENDGAAVQGGLDWSHSSGVYLGYWGSSLGYGDASKPNPQTTGFESDIYGGYKFKAGPVALDVGLIQYLYTAIGDADGLEAVVNAGIGPVTVGVKYLTGDVVWGNKGDIYTTVGYTQALPSDFKLAGVLGYYVYKDSGEFIPATVESSAFRHVDLKLSHPLGKTGADMSLTYIVGGKDRQGLDQSNAIVLGLSTGF
jgi:uncharacterized protein (TIGR02001 family)